MKKPIKGLDWLEAALRRIAADRAENLARFVAFDARMEEARKLREDARERQAEVHKAWYAELMAKRSGQPPKQPKPPKPRNRRPGEGGEPMPAVPRPKPKPLSGGAAVPIKVKGRVTKTAGQPQRVKTRPAKVPYEADRSPSF